MNKQDTAGVIAPPPLIYLLALVIGLILRALAPTPFLPHGVGYVLGAALIVIAVSLLFCVRVMRGAGTSEKTSIPTTALVTTGPFQFSRNPLYVLLTLLYLGIAIAAQSLWAVALLIAVLAVMQGSSFGPSDRFFSATILGGRLHPYSIPERRPWEAWRLHW